MESLKISSKEHIVITGGAGFIGSHLSERLLLEGKKVTILTRNIRTPRASKLERLGATLLPWDCSTSQNPSYPRQLAGAELFLHMAADVSVRSPALYSTNVDGTKRALNMAEESSIPYFICASSIEAQGLGRDQDIPLGEEAECHPVSDYGRSKGKAEEIVENWGLEKNRKTLILRIGNIYGPGSPWFIRPCLFTLLWPESVRPIWVELRKRKFQPLYIADLVEGVIQAAKKQLHGIYNISGANSFSIEQYFSKLASLMKLTKQFELLQGLSRDVEYSGTNVDPEFSYVLMGNSDQRHRVYATDKLRREIGDYVRWPLSRGLAATLKWFSDIGGLTGLLNTLPKH